MGQATDTFLDEPPFSETLTSYDREHMKLYMRLLDADRMAQTGARRFMSSLALTPTAIPSAAARFMMHISHVPAG